MNKRQGFGIGLPVFAAGLLLAGLPKPASFHAPRTAADHPGATATGPSWPCTVVPKIASTIPSDTLSDQADVDCFAWQEFIALNWQALNGQRGQPDPSQTPANFGTAGFNPTVWETYKAAQEVFLAKGTTNPTWNQAPPPPSCTNALPAAALRGRRVMTMTSKATDDFDSSAVEQAYPFNGPNWLADINGNPVWFEMKLNQTEFNEIVRGAYFNLSAQQCIVAGGAYNSQTQVCTPKSATPQQVKLPVNSMELKATWRQLTDASQYAQYLTANAIVVQNGTCTPMTLGLVGLHIVQKTPSQPNWIWATFEQVSNSPSNSSPGTTAYSFYNPSCKVAAVPPSCNNGTPTSTTCTSNTPPVYSLDSWFSSKACAPYGVQVTRLTPLSSLTQKVNAAAEQMIVSANSKSVFQNYQLIDAVWTTSPNDPYANSGQPETPLPMPHMDPGYSVASTVAETYIQNTSPPQLPIPPQPGSMCITCHRYASTAGSANPRYGSDYSFLLGLATSPVSLKPAVRSLLSQKDRR